MQGWPRKLTHYTLLVVTMLAASTALAAGGVDDPVLPQSSTNRFLNGVPDYAGGKPSPSIIYPTDSLNTAQPEQTSSGPSVTVYGEPSGQSGRSSGGLRGGGTINKQPIIKTPVERRTIQSPWQTQ